MTWVNGSTGLSSTGLAGAVLPANSLIGTTMDDEVGSGGVTALSNGNYAVSSPLWDNTVQDTNCGAVT